MTAPGPLAPHTSKSGTAAQIGTVLWALMPMVTCGIGAPIAFGTALARRRSRMTVVGLVVYSVALLAWLGLAGTYGDQGPAWTSPVILVLLMIASLVSTVHLFVIRPAVWAPPTTHRVPVARLSGTEAVDRARRLRYQARQTVAADPMLAKRLGIGRPDLPRQFDDGGLVDLNHAPVEVLRTLPGVTEASARQIRHQVERSGPFQSLGEVLLLIEISPTFEHHLREYVVFIP